MQNEILQIKQSGFVIRLIINRPAALNALNRAVFEALEDFFTNGYKTYGRIDGVIITGSGEKAFVAGADIAELANLDQQTAVQLVDRGHRIMDTIESFHTPVIAVVKGYALGGGCELAMACHLRLATPKARFGLPELGLGLIPGYGGTQRLVRNIGPAKALEYILTSDFIDADTAEQLGLVNKVYAEDQIDGAAESLINKIATRGPKAVTYAIRSVNAYSPGSSEGFDIEKAFFTELTQSAEGKEGLSAFLDKRKPDFRK